MISCSIGSIFLGKSIIVLISGGIFNLFGCISGNIFFLSKVRVDYRSIIIIWASGILSISCGWFIRLKRSWNSIARKIIIFTLIGRRMVVLNLRWFLFYLFDFIEGSCLILGLELLNFLLFFLGVKVFFKFSWAKRIGFNIRILLNLLFLMRGVCRNWRAWFVRIQLFFTFVWRIKLYLLVNWFFLSRSICMITNNLYFNFLLLLFLLFGFKGNCTFIL